MYFNKLLPLEINRKLLLLKSNIDDSYHDYDLNICLNELFSRLELIKRENNFSPF